MSLSVTGPSVLIGDPNTTGQIEFIPTDMDAVDGRGKSTGHKLLIAKIPLTNEARNRINTHLLARRQTHGTLVMHRDGVARVWNRTTDRGFCIGESFGGIVSDEFNPHHSLLGVKTLKYGVQFVPDGSLVLADPNFAMHPAVKMTWYESISLAFALEQADSRFRVRLMRDSEYTRFVRWDGKYTEEEVIARAHLDRNSITGTASVEDASAALRTTEEGFVDVVGNVWIWTDNAVRPEILAKRMNIDLEDVDRILRGASFSADPENMDLDYLLSQSSPGSRSIMDGARFVAVYRR